MEALQIIKSRIASISGTRQITQSMRLVSTAKVQKARARMSENEIFLNEARRLTGVAVREAENKNHRYLRAGSEGKHGGLIVIAGDRGLCGGYNINVNREAVNLARSLDSTKVVTVGSKARDFWRRRKKVQLGGDFTGISENPFFEDAEEISRLVRGWYDSGEINQIYMVYTRFESMLSQTPIVKKLLPLEDMEQPSVLTRCEPSGEDFLSAVIPFYLTANIFGAILESSCCEQSARITSMDSAVRNSDEMITKLTLLYNQARQGAITQELIEIVGGAQTVVKE